MDNRNDNQGGMENYYSILGCTQSASVDELKHCYQDLIRQYHPDKQNGSNTSSDRFILIDTAFRTLKDEKLRKEYDASLLVDNFSENPIVFAELSKSEIIFTDGEYVFNCRCGSNIIILDSLREKTFVECSECSNYILIK